MTLKQPCGMKACRSVRSMPSAGWQDKEVLRMHAKLSTPAYRRVIAAGAGAALAAIVAACGSSGPAKPAASPSTSPAASAPATGAAAEAAVKTAWVAFFNPKTPVSQRVALLQNGQTFASIIKAQASSALAQSASATVSKVTLVSPTQATVKYSIVVGGQPALANQTGVAVYQNGSWKVGDASFCALLAVENGGKTSGLPAVCHGA
ncbi:MAG TPA: hypothetical protein VMV92_34485 [Streptosporangiaceae bacterium]|nr:hypothetical protein [Streptosporangiaceae bacterium]